MAEASGETGRRPAEPRADATDDGLRRLEWMLRPGHERAAEAPEEWAPPYGDLVALNTCRVILDAVGSATLADIVAEYLDLLDTSSAVYEANGDYALGIFSSGWCRFMDAASRRRCGTDDDRSALGSGRWLCHESCWTGASKIAIETGMPTDIACAGGLRLHAIPIRGGTRIVGAINIGYGDPPRDAARLEELAEAFGVSAAELSALASAYESRPPFIVELAKRRLRSAARLIGEIVERHEAQAQREALLGQLAHSQRLESIGRLAGGVAHDFNNMLGIILGHTELALEQVDRWHPLHDDLCEIREAATRSAGLTRQLLAFARKQVVAPRVLDLNEVTEGTLKMLRRLIGEDIQLLWLPGAPLWPIRIDPIQIDQVLANLCLNARDAIAGAGRVSIETRNVVLGEASGPVPVGYAPGEYVLLAVDDDGSGMDEETLSHLFEPFYTTKGVGQGTGLGLATVYGVIHQNGGFVDVASTPGQGTTFRLYFTRYTGPDAIGA